jgi:hypothetical protein
MPSVHRTAPCGSDRYMISEHADYSVPSSSLSRRTAAKPRHTPLLSTSSSLLVRGGEGIRVCRSSLMVRLRPSGNGQCGTNPPLPTTRSLHLRALAPGSTVMHPGAAAVPYSGCGLPTLATTDARQSYHPPVANGSLVRCCCVH